MDIYNLIRSGIFLVAGLVCIIFRKGLNNWKNCIMKKLNIKKWVRDERRGYVYFGIGCFIISIGLFVFAVTH